MSLISETDKRSVSYHTNMYEPPELNSRMFIEDFGRNLVPDYGSKLEAITCKLEPDSKEAITSLYELLPLYGRNYKPSFKNVILETIEYIAHHLLNTGIVVLELVKYIDVNEREFHKLELIDGKEIKIKKDIIIQIVPDDVAKELGTNKVDIPIEKCFVIEFPKSLGGKEKYLEFLKDFRELGNLSPLINILNNPLQGQANYDINEHQHLFDIELWRKTKLYSWHQRGIGEGKISGYYYIYRHLLFRKNKIKLRDYIVEELCKIILTLSEKVFGQKAELKIEGLLTIDKVEEKLAQWKTGELDPKTLNDLL